MRLPFCDVVEKGRLIDGSAYSSRHGQPYGCFYLKCPDGRHLKVIACHACKESGGWEHVSVSLVAGRDMTPTWTEMNWVKDLFWKEDETVVQFHPKKSSYVNLYPGCLHLWRHPEREIELLPTEAV